MSYLQIKQLVKSFGNVQALKGISLDIPEGHFTALLGPSGCGKSTMLRLIAGLEQPTSGEIYVAGENVTDQPPEQRKLGMMFQSYALFPHMTVEDNIRFPLRMQRKYSRQEQDQRIRDVLQLVKLGELEQRRPNQLSGGQQQRVALARAIVAEPRVLLLDEPLSNLDARLREEMQVELIEMHRRLGLTTLFVTHDQDEALSLSNTVVLMNAGEVEQIGAPETIYAQPQTSFAADFIGSANLLPVRISQENGEWWGQILDVDDERFPVLPPENSKPGNYQLMLRQEDLQLMDNPNERDVALPITIQTRVYKGAIVQYVVKTYHHTLKVQASKSQIASNEDDLYLCWNIADALPLL